MSKKILIVGIGGVGGYFGGLLSRFSQKSENVKVYFMARGENLKAIQQNGMEVTKGTDQFTTYPQMASDNPSDFGPVDYIILCTKSYDLEDTLASINPSVKSNIVFLPLLNGVDSTDKITAIYPK